MRKAIFFLNIAFLCFMFNVCFAETKESNTHYILDQIKGINEIGNGFIDSAIDILDRELKKENTTQEQLKNAIGNYRSVVESVYLDRENTYLAWIDRLKKHGIDKVDIKLVELALVKSEKEKNEELRDAYQEYQTALKILQKKYQEDYKRKMKELADFNKETEISRKEWDWIIAEEERKLNEGRR